MRKVDPARAALLRCSPVKIGADYFQIKIIPNDAWQEGDGNIGVISFKKLEIKIRDTVRGYVLADVVLHECLHAIWNDGFANLLDHNQSVANLQEIVASTYESGLAALFLDNPKLLKLCYHYWQPAARKRKD